MKRILTILVLGVYFTVTSGFAVSLHYCMDELSGIELGAAASDVCPKCGMDGAATAADGCCRDEVKLVQHKGETPAVASLHFSFSFLSAEAFPVAPYAAALLPSGKTFSTPFIRPPPLIGDGARYLLLSVFRL